MGDLADNKKATEENIKKGEFESKDNNLKTAIDPKVTHVRSSMRREDQETAPDGKKSVSEKPSIRWGLVFVDGQIVVPIDFRRRKMETEAKMFRWLEENSDIETTIKSRTTRHAPNQVKKTPITETLR